MNYTATPPTATASPLSALGIALAGALLIGFLTSFAQGWLPAPISSLANSSGSWSLAAFLLALLGRRMWVSVGIGVLALVAMVLGYDLASTLRGFGVSPFYTLFWGAAAVTVGPLLGWSAHMLRHRNRWAPVGVGFMAGILVGDGANGLLTVLETTSPVYWTLSILGGLALLVWACARRFPRARPVLTAVATTVLVAGLICGVYATAHHLLSGGEPPAPTESSTGPVTVPGFQHHTFA